MPFSKRVPKEYWVLSSTPLWLDTVPLPLLRSPFHAADAVRFIDGAPVEGRGACAPGCSQYAIGRGADAVPALGVASPAWRDLGAVRPSRYAGLRTDAVPRRY